MNGCMLQRRTDRGSSIPISELTRTFRSQSLGKAELSFLLNGGTGGGSVWAPSETCASYWNSSWSGGKEQGWFPRITISKILVLDRGRGEGRGCFPRFWKALCYKTQRARSVRERSLCVLLFEPSPPKLLLHIAFQLGKGAVSTCDAARGELWEKAVGRCGVPVSRPRARPAPMASVSPR